VNEFINEQNTSQDIKYLSEIKIASYYERNLKEKFKDTKRAI
jgi:2-oxoglutarate dehydrogenase complex dehydrogenase (E1) component-like enzyme